MLQHLLATDSIEIIAGKFANDTLKVSENELSYFFTHWQINLHIYPDLGRSCLYQENFDWKMFY